MNCACGCDRIVPVKARRRGRPQLYFDARCRKLAEYRRRAAARAGQLALERAEPTFCPCGCGVAVVSKGARGRRRVYATAACRPRAARARAAT